MPLGEPVRGPGMSFPSRELSRELGFGILTSSPEPKVHLPARLFTSYYKSASQLALVLLARLRDETCLSRSAECEGTSF